ncbi:hypothetical protein [Gimesia fumaroli]|uniref:Uncharacterized protein n=1 Tax=Gimesia fumaroli TaxID=2527976 RepID=A0A518I8Y8_9PLAN|nr:hypothetical protein [Gimesia fumaroli]QDV49560.1 hypothetical protein Enr17x_15800 [Gimesia fumaroli]
MSPDAAQNLRMQKAAGITYGDSGDVYSRNTILAYALMSARNHRDVTNKRELKRLVKADVREQLSRDNYGIIDWTMLLWWVLPKLIEWFVTWWLEDNNQ